MIETSPLVSDGPLSAPPASSLAHLADRLDDNAHLLSLGNEAISQAALAAAKDIFDYALSLEPLSHPHLHPFLASILDQPTIVLRSATKSAKAKPDAPPPPKPEEILPYTPLSELTTAGLDDEQVWQQLDLRNAGMVRVAGQVGSGQEDDDENAAASSGEDDSEDGGSDEEMTLEEFEAMMAEAGDESGSEDDEDDSEDEDEDEDDDEDDEDESGEDEGENSDSDGGSLDSETENQFALKRNSTRVLTADEDSDKDDEDAEDDEDDMDDMDEDDEAETDEDHEDEDEAEDEDDEEMEASGISAASDNDEDDSAVLNLPGPSTRRDKPRHPTLDDDFFSIDEFNRLTEEAEAGRVSSGRLGGEEEDEEELGDVGELMLRGAAEDEALMYSDFFEPPRNAPKAVRLASKREAERKGKGKGKAEDEKKKKKRRDRSVRFVRGSNGADEDGDLDVEDEDDDGDEEDEDAGRGVMGRVKGDLFDSDEEDGEDKVLSTHEKQQAALRKQIAELESEAIGPKDWTLLGEASSRARPENSLLEENLDFEHAGKIVPTITEETVKTLEELIKKRILDNHFDSVERVRAYEPTPFVPSRFLELQDTQSSKSLAQIYEEEYQAASSGSKVKDPRDEKLRKEHEEIQKAWDDVCYKLDALSSLNFVPKQPKGQISTVDNLPTTTLETALPTTSTHITMLAPEELFAPPTSASLVSRSELTPEEAHRQRGKARKQKAAQRKSLGELAELYGKSGGKKKVSVKEQKEAAMKNLVKTGKGVTVVGKGGKEEVRAKGRKRASEGEQHLLTTTSVHKEVNFRPGSSRLNPISGSSTSYNPAHGRGQQRPRSQSRSSSSPSPPPPSVQSIKKEHGEKRRSFSHKNSPYAGVRGRGVSTSARGSSERLERYDGSGPDRPGSPAGLASSGHAPVSSSTMTALGYGAPGPSRLSLEVDTSEHVGSRGNGHNYNSLGGSALTDGGGFSTYGASASSPGGASASEKEDHFVSARGETTEVEDARRRRAVLKELKADARIPSPTPPPALISRTAQPSRKLTLNSSSPSPAAGATIMPLRIGLAGLGRVKQGAWDAGFTITRRRCEDGLLLFAVIVGVVKLGHHWDEKALSGEIGLLVILSVTYVTFRVRSPRQPATTASSPVPRPLTPDYLSASLGNNVSRDRPPRLSFSGTASPTGVRDDARRSLAGDGQLELGGVGCRGCVWGTEEREYRECLDDGALFALLLGPLIAAGLLQDSLSRFTSASPTLRPRMWMIEPPLVLDSTPIRRLSEDSTRIATETLRALSALVISRRNLVQLFTLCSFVLLVHLARSLYLEVKLNRLQSSSNDSSSASMDREGSDPGRPLSSLAGGTGTYWLRRGEWRRTKSVVGFAFLVTGGCIVVKIGTAFVGHGVWSDMSPSDIVIATLFNQFSLYVCVRLARRGFTLGELAIVCNAATALFMESVNLTRMKIGILRTPYIKTFRLPTPLLIFQLALIPGSLLAGFLLSPLLYLSRHLAQKPAHRLRFPDEKAMHRRLLALSFYGGAFIICAGLVGTWTRWCLNWRDPFLWVVWWIKDGRKWWTRSALLGYWGALAMISVAGWNRQLVRARRHRRYVVPGTKDMVVGNIPPGGEGSLKGVATQVMDAADQRLPTLSVNARRKFFHALAVIMFVPGIAVDPAFTHLSFSVAFAAFNFAEYIRYFALWPFGVSVHLFLNEFLDSKDSGTAILSHFYLLTGCASPLWLEGSEVLSYYGVLVLGIGDALASIVGRRVGKVKWCAASGKTLEGSIAFVGSVLVSTMFLWAFGIIKAFNPLPYALTTILTALLEAVSAQNDNLILPMYGWAIGTLLGV